MVFHSYVKLPEGQDLYITTSPVASGHHWAPLGTLPLQRQQHQRDPRGCGAAWASAVAAMILQCFHVQAPWAASPPKNASSHTAFARLVGFEARAMEDISMMSNCSVFGSQQNCSVIVIDFHLHELIKFWLVQLRHRFLLAALFILRVSFITGLFVLLFLTHDLRFGPELELTLLAFYGDLYPLNGII